MPTLKTKFEALTVVDGVTVGNYTATLYSIREYLSALDIYPPRSLMYRITRKHKVYRVSGDTSRAVCGVQYKKMMKYGTVVEIFLRRLK